MLTLNSKYVLFLALGLFTSCGRNLDYYVTEGVTQADIVGSWTLATSDGKSAEYEPQHLRIYGDGSYECSRLPIDGLNARISTNLTAKGTWRFEQGVAYQKLVLVEGTNQWCVLFLRVGGRIDLVTQTEEGSIYEKTRLRPSTKDAG